MILNAEMLLLKLVDHNLFLRDHLIIDRVKLYLEYVKTFVEDSYRDKLRNLCENIVRYLFDRIEFFIENETNKICIAIINSAIILATKTNERNKIISKRNLNFFFLKYLF